MSRRRPVYALSWEPPATRRCLGCARWLHESQVAAHDLSARPPLRWCERCLRQREAQLEARLTMQAAWRALTTARTAVVSGVA